MNRLIAGWAPMIVLLGGLAAMADALPAQEIDVQPLAFVHPDEIIRGRGFAVVADRRTFAVTAFINAVGYDEEAEGAEMHPVRVRVRELMVRNLHDKAERLDVWKAFYAEVDLPAFVYLDYALSLSGDYPFQRIRPNDEVGYPQVLDSMDRLIPLLNEFWMEADMESVWTAVKPSYLEALGRYDFGKMEEQMQALWSYLRLPRRDTYTIINVPNLVDRHYHAIGAQYETYYFTVESPGAQNYALNTHEYLHSIVNPLASDAFASQSEKLTRYFEAGREGRFARSYQHAPTFASESLVRALDYRLRLRSAESDEAVTGIQARVDEITAGGLSLVRPFFDGLEAFEQDDRDFAEYIAILFASVPDLSRSGS